MIYLNARVCACICVCLRTCTGACAGVYIVGLMHACPSCMHIFNVSGQTVGAICLRLTHNEESLITLMHGLCFRVIQRALTAYNYIAYISYNFTYYYNFKHEMLGVVGVATIRAVLILHD